MSFIFESIRIWDILDIILVTFLLYQIYMLIRGTVAINIFLGIFLFYLFWVIVKALDMKLLGSILGQIIGLGLITLIIVFQQEIRRFLILIGTSYFKNQKLYLEKFLGLSVTHLDLYNFEALSIALKNMALSKTGALIAVSGKSKHQAIAETGVVLNADLSTGLLESIFYKNAPLHDGGVILYENKILAAKCVFPVSESRAIPKKLGMRHRAAVGMSEQTDTLVIIVSEQTGKISYAYGGKLYQNIQAENIEKTIRERIDE